MIRSTLRRKGWVEKKFHFLTSLVPSVDGDGEGVLGRVSACVFCMKCVCLSRRPRVGSMRALRCGPPQRRGWPLGPQPRRPGVDELFQTLVLVTSRCIHIQASCLDVVHRPSAAWPWKSLFWAQLPPGPCLAPCHACSTWSSLTGARPAPPPHRACTLLAPGSPLGLHAVHGTGPFSGRSGGHHGPSLT